VEKEEEEVTLKGSLEEEEEEEEPIGRGRKYFDVLILLTNMVRSSRCKRSAKYRSGENCHKM